MTREEAKNLLDGVCRLQGLKPDFVSFRDEFNIYQGHEQAANEISLSIPGEKAYTGRGPTWAAALGGVLAEFESPAEQEAA